jgi:adenylate cyclase
LAEDSTAAKTSNRRVRLLVMPFHNLTGDPGQEYFSDAITDEIITALTNLAPERLAVLARGTSLHYKKSRKDLVSISRELDVDYLVEGGVRRAGDQLVANVQLIQGSDQTHLLAKKYEGSMSDLFVLQNDIAQAIAVHLPVLAEYAPTPTKSPHRDPDFATEKLAAYNEYIQARYQINMAKTSPGEIALAKQHLERALALDPLFAPAHDCLAEVCWYLGYLGIVSPRKSFSTGIVHALRALEIDNLRAETHALLGQFHKTAEYNWPEVHREMSIARQLNPNSPLVKMRYAVSELMPQGQLEEAIAELEGVLESDPLSILPRAWLGIVLVLARQFERGIENGLKMLEIDPTSAMAHFVLGLCHKYLNRTEEELACLRRAAELSGGGVMVLAWLGMALVDCGEIAEAREVLHHLYDMAVEKYVSPCSFAWIHLALGEIDTAFTWLGRAVEECDQLMMPIKNYHFLDPIRGDPRFAVLLRQMNLG